MTEAQLLERFIEASDQLKLPDIQAGLCESFSRMTNLLEVEDACLLYFDAGGRIQWCYITGQAHDLSLTAKGLVVAQHIQQQGIGNWALRHRQTIYITDVSDDSRWATIPDYTAEVGSALCIPIMDDNRAQVLMLLTHPKVAPFTLEQQQLAALYTERVQETLHKRQLESQIQLQQIQSSALLEAVPDMLLLLDRQGQILQVNKAALRLLDVNTPQQALGKNLSQMILPDKTLSDAINMMQHGVIGEAYEFRSDPLRSNFIVHLSNWTSGYIIRVRDLGREDELARFKDELLRMASNDLRSSLALIIGYAHMIGLDTPNPASPVHKHIEIIEDATNRMNDLLEALLQAEQIRNTPLELQEKINPAKLVKIVVVNTRLAAEEKNLYFTFDIRTADETVILADPVLIRQAMEKLVENAIQYTQAGGVEIEAYADTRRFYFLVRDTGTGIPEAHISHIFEPFYRWESKGAGLGLSLVRDVVERHEGAVWMESEVGEGSTFGFWLPLRHAIQP